MNSIKQQPFVRDAAAAEEDDPAEFEAGGAFGFAREVSSRTVGTSPREVKQNQGQQGVRHANEETNLTAYRKA